MSEREEMTLEAGFVLHQRPYRNTSLIIDCLTERCGRIGLVGRGARRPGRRQTADLQPFRRVRLSWVRRGELGRLTHVEQDGPAGELEGDRLLAGFYINELLLRLLPASDPNEQIFCCYSECLEQLARGSGAARPLRLFELKLLDALGYRVDLEQDFRTGALIEPDREYVFEHEGGLTASTVNRTMDSFHGKHLISLREHRLDDVESLTAAKRLLGGILRAHLGGRPLRTREVMREILDRSLSF